MTRIFILLLGILLSDEAIATATVQVASGGGSVTADSVGGAYTILTGPVLTETNNPGMSTGSIIR